MRPKPAVMAPPQRGVRTRRTAGALVIAFGLLCYPAGFAVLKVGTDAGRVLRLLSFAAGPGLIGAAWPIIRLGRRLVATFGDWAEIEGDPRPPIVYLRPFAEDRVQYVTPWRSRVAARPWRRLLGETSYEQRLARALAGVAPFAAIANPAKGPSPELGGKQFRVADTEWQHRVAELTSRAGSVIVHAGVSDGLAWEIEHLVGLGTPGRLIIALPSDAGHGRPSPEKRYAAFVDRFRNVFPRGLPDRVGESQFLFFDADWNPRLFGHRGSRPPPSGKGEQRAIVLDRLGSEFKVSDFPYWLRAAAGASLAIVAGIAVATALYAALR